MALEDIRMIIYLNNSKLASVTHTLCAKYVAYVLLLPMLLCRKDVIVRIVQMRKLRVRVANSFGPCSAIRKC